MVRCSFLVWMVTGSVAFAADVNEDGCQDEYAANLVVDWLERLGHREL